MRRTTITLGLLGALWAPTAHAQVADADCTYRVCALNIVPRLYGLQVVRGEAEHPVATLGFFWTRDISVHFDGEARQAARSAVRLRRGAALLTDLGLILAVAGVASASADDLDIGSTLGIVGVSALAASVPLQFRADRALGRALWIHNSRYAR